MSSPRHHDRARYTRDREADVDANHLQSLGSSRARFYTTEQLSERRSRTPEGFLLVRDVPIARVGPQDYAAHELPGLKGKFGVISIMRSADEVFKPSAIDSFAGKPITNDHPPVRVTPDNWRHYAVGTVMQPRRGDGVHFDNNFLYADLLVTDASAIADIEAGKREVSAGYDAQYEQTTDGEGRQSNIIGNHVALVRKGRCGPLCMIGDHAMPRQRLNRRALVRDRIMDAVRTSNVDQALEELDKIEEMMGEQVSGDADPQHVSIHLHGNGGGVGGGAGTASLHDDPAAVVADPTPSGAAGAAPPWAQEILQRMDRMEQAIVLLAQGDDDEGDENGEEEGEDNNDAYYARDRGGRRRRGRVRDEEANPPPSDEPEPRPAEGNSAYGVGTGATTYGRSNPGGDTPGITRRGTTDHRTPPSRNGTRQHFVGDSSSLQPEFVEMLARAETLVPGFQLPTFDAAAPAQQTHDSMCGTRIDVLTTAYRDASKRPFIDAILGGRQFNPNMTCDAATMIFNGASEMSRMNTNQAISHARIGSLRAGGGAITPATINEINRKKYGMPVH